MHDQRADKMKSIFDLEANLCFSLAWLSPERKVTASLATARGPA
jgi:hypothetical protein